MTTNEDGQGLIGLIGRLMAVLEAAKQVEVISSGSGPAAPTFDEFDVAVERARGDWYTIDGPSFDHLSAAIKSADDDESLVLLVRAEVERLRQVAKVILAITDAACHCHYTYARDIMIERCRTARAASQRGCEFARARRAFHSALVATENT